MISIRFASCAIAASAVLAAGLFAATVVQAGDCNADIAGLSQKRQTFIEKLNVLAKASKGKLDPVSSCPALRGLVAAEGQLIKYLDTNKNWCNVPDETVANLKAADVKSQGFASKACELASQARQQQKQAASGGSPLGVEAQKLPTGPL